MPRFAANLSFLFPDAPFAQRFARAAQAGFTAVECLFPYELPAQDIAQLLQQHSLCMVLHNLNPGDWAAGERGLACLPGREAEFEASVAQALHYAQTLGVRQLHCLAGIAPAGASDAQLHSTYLRNLRYAANAFAPTGIKLLIEPINRYDMPGYYLHSLAQAERVLDELDALGADDAKNNAKNNVKNNAKNNVYLQFDIYHLQRIDEPTTAALSATLQRLLPRIAHVQLADHPGRHEPGTGHIDYRSVLQQLDAMGYSGNIGCEYHPLDTSAGGTERGLNWLAEYGLALA
jgi:hydroxypyruvate isomerase